MHLEIRYMFLFLYKFNNKPLLRPDNIGSFLINYSNYIQNEQNYLWWVDLFWV